jgi:hypothetical protein
MEGLLGFIATPRVGTAHYDTTLQKGIRRKKWPSDKAYKAKQSSSASQNDTLSRGQAVGEAAV